MKPAFRILRQSPGFTIVAVLMLALGIGANTAIFSFINAFFLRAQPFAKPEELVTLFTLEERNAGTMPLSHPNYLSYRDHNTVFSGLAAHWWANVRYLEKERAIPLNGEIVSGNYFDVLGTRAALGRTFLPEEYATEGTHPVVVVSHSFWQNNLGANPAIVGRTLTFNGTPFTVVGVAPVNFRGVYLLNSPAFWVPTAMHRTLLFGLASDFFHSRRAVSVGVIGRLKPGVTAAQADAVLAPLAQKLAQDYPEDNAGRSVRVLPLDNAGLNPAGRADFLRAGTLLISLTAIVLLIACANLANLLLARAAARQREIALRLALGASRRRIAGELLTESALLAVLGGATGILVAFWARDILWSLRPSGFPADFAVPLDARVLGFTLLVSVATGLLFGLAPAWSSTRVDLIGVLKRETSTGGSGRFPLFGFRNLLVAAQVALSVVALVIAGLFIRSLQRAQNIDPGWNAKNLALVHVDLAGQGYDQNRAHEYHARAVALLRTVPGVVDATIASKQFFTGRNPQRTVRPQGSPDETLRTRGQLMSYASVMPGYLRFMGIPLAAGRDFEGTDDDTRPLVIIINETFARRAWPALSLSNGPALSLSNGPALSPSNGPGENALGKQVKLFGSETLVEVVGIVRDTLYHDLAGEPTPFVFFAYRQIFHQNTVLHIRTAGDPVAMFATLQKELQTLDPALPLIGMRTMEGGLENLLWGPRTGARLMSVFGALGLLLAGLGVYAIMAHSVSQRTREIGIRIAIGAQTHDVLTLILRRGLVVTVVGLLAGLILAYALARHYQKFFAHVHHLDPLTYGAIALLLSLAALLACWLPARRATRVNPISALRAE